MNSVSILLLAYNEARTITSEIESWIMMLNNAEIEIDYEIILVEDGSTDGTTSILENLHQQGKIIHLHEKIRSGYNNALMRGISKSSKDYIFLSDTGQKNDLMDFWALWLRRNTADLIVGKKAFRSDPVQRQILTKLLNVFIRYLTKSKEFRDVDSGFRLMNQSFSGFLKLHPIEFRRFAGCEMALLTKLNKFAYLEVPVSYDGRIGASRSLPLSIIPRSIFWLFKDIAKLYSKKGPTYGQ